MLQNQLAKIGNDKICPVAVIVKGRKILMGHRHYTPDKWKNILVWTSPGGRCDAGERLEQTLRREVQEETGITNLEIIDYIGEVPGAKEGDIVPLFYCATNQEPQLMEPEKFSEWRWIDFDDYEENRTADIINEEARKLIVEYLRAKL